MLRRCAPLALVIFTLVCIPAVAQAARLTWVAPIHRVALHQAPDFNSSVTATVAARVDGVPQSLRVVGSITTSGQQWLRVSGKSMLGWVEAAKMHRAGPPSLNPFLTHRLARILAPISKSISMTIETPQGQVLFTHDSNSVKTLASNTKLFTVAAALNLRGSLGPLTSQIITPSDNYLADQLSTSIGGPGVAVRYARSLGVTVHLYDGCGLDPRDRASSMSVANFLVAEQHGRGFQQLYNALPVAGKTGTLADRMNGTAAQGRIHAKTGTLYTVAALSGFVDTIHRHHYIFSILVNGPGYAYDRTIIDRAATFLAAQG